MRFGNNPYKSAQVSHPRNVTVAVLVFIPHLTGYFEQRLDILKLCIASILKHTDHPYDLLILDNGSCSPVIDYLLDLRAQGALQYLILSQHNLGVLGAYNVIFSAAPGRYVAYSDDDMLFHPGWLSEQLRIVEAFPKVGMVSGLPTWQNFGLYTAGTLALASSDPSIEIQRSKGWPLEWAREYSDSIGWDLDGFIERCRDIEVVRLTKNGVSAFATSTHCQFVVSKAAVATVLPLDPGGRAVETHRFDEQLDRAGFIRLSTVRPFVQHMGNHLSPQTLERVAESGLGPQFTRGVEAPPAPAILRRLLSHPRARQVLHKVYGKTFYWISISEGRWGERQK